jgi:pimeloyl-ACP methyl ester carboxylesterase
MLTVPPSGGMPAPVLTFVLALALAAFAAPAVWGATAAQQGHPCHLPGYDQTLRCITVNVPLDYQQPRGAHLALQVTLAPALRESARPDPLFVLAGGPGQAGSEILPLLDSAFRHVRATRDIVFIDQRGTGLSGKLDCDSTQALEEQSLPQQEQAVAACMRKLNRPFAFYNTENSARDLDLIRAALGYRQIDIWGSSYGTRLGQVYARLYPGAVRAMILDAVAAPEQIIFAWGRDAQAALDATFTHCAEDADCHAAYPQLPQQFAALLQRVNAGTVALDVAHPRTARRLQLQLSPERFLQAVRTALYAPDSASRLPYLIASAEQDNWLPFVAQMYSMQDFSFDGPSIGLMLAVTCAEDIPRLTPAIIADEQHNSFMAGLEVRLIPAWCRYVQVPPVPYVEPSVISAPVLLLSGALDPVTPPHRAASAALHIAHAQQFVVANAGHGVSQLGCAPRLLREFLDRPEQALAAQCLKDIPRNRFQLGAAGPHP